MEGLLIYTLFFLSCIHDTYVCLDIHIILPDANNIYGIVIFIFLGIEVLPSLVAGVVVCKLFTF